MVSNFCDHALTPDHAHTHFTHEIMKNADFTNKLTIYEFETLILTYKCDNGILFNHSLKSQ